MYSLMIIKKKIKSLDDMATIQSELGLSPLTDKFENVISTLSYYKDKQLRKNGVLALDIYFETNDNDININKWRKDNEIWATNYFSGIVLGEKYIDLSMHLIIVPIDSNGKIGIEEYIGSKGKLITLQKSYTLLMKSNYSLVRPSSDIIKRFVNEKTNSYTQQEFDENKLPELLPNEDIQAYQDKMKIYINTLNLRHKEREQKIINTRKISYTKETKQIIEENKTLQKYIEPFISLTEKHGSLKNMNQMLHTASIMKYAFRSCKESNNMDKIQAFQEFMKIGEKYISDHKLDV